MQRKTDALMFPLTEPYIIPTTFLALDHRDIKVTKDTKVIKATKATKAIKAIKGVV